jgi:peptide/nickel transport system ATP-binding protein
VQAVVFSFLQELKGRLGMSYLFVAHDLHVVRLLCDRVIVMRSADGAHDDGAGSGLHARATGRCSPPTG